MVLRFSDDMLATQLDREVMGHSLFGFHILRALVDTQGPRGWQATAIIFHIGAGREAS
jgi:hypothetical protein